MKKVKEKVMSACPICQHGRFLNRLAKDRFFCLSCLNEFRLSGKKTYLLEINDKNGDVKTVLI